MDPIYLDNNSTTPMLPAVWEAMRPFASEIYGNPASAHRSGAGARRALEEARDRLASILGAHADEVVFTSGATEANNLAILGLAGSTCGHILASRIEHPSVGEPVEQLGRQGFVVERLPVDEHGIVETTALREHLRPETRLVCVMLANHETGAIQPIAAISAALPTGAAFHCDAVQAVGKIPVHFHDLGVATFALSAHKFHGPKGIGALIVRRSTKLRPLLSGGHQQQGRRPGTEPVALVVGMATALELWQRDAAERTAKVKRLRRSFLEILNEKAAPIVLNGAADGIPHTINISFPGCQADVLLMNLDLAGVACSTGSACSSGSLLPSPVLQAMRVPNDVLASAMRFSFSPLLTDGEVCEAANRVASVVCRLRTMSPS